MIRRAALALTIAALASSALASWATPTSAQAAEYCSAPHLVEHARWSLCWELEELRGQGLEATVVHYDGLMVFWRMGVPFGITDYPARDFNDPIKDVLGIASPGGNQPGAGRGALAIDAAACPRWLSSGTLVNGDKVCVETSNGPIPRVAVWSRFDLANYRFIQGYVFGADGSVEPRVLLGGKLIDADECGDGGGSSCTPHYHYLYWRFDIDLDGAAADHVQEFRAQYVAATNQNELDPPTCGAATGASWCTILHEGGRDRDASAFMKWRVVDFASRNPAGHPRSIELRAASEGTVTAMSTSDVWAVRSVGSSDEIGYEVPVHPSSDAALDAYASPAARMDGQDVVLWYAEKVHHEPRDEETPSMIYHSLGPRLDLRNFVGSNAAEPSYP